MKETHLSLYSCDSDLPVENYIFGEKLKAEDGTSDLYLATRERLAELDVIPKQGSLYLHVRREYDLAQFIEVANACAKYDTSLTVVHHREWPKEPDYQMVFPKVIYFDGCKTEDGK